MDKILLENARLKQVNFALNNELKEVLKAVDRYCRIYDTPTYVKEFGRKVSLDFDNPLYPYSPFRLTKEEIYKHVKKTDSKRS